MEYDEDTIDLDALRVRLAAREELAAEARRAHIRAEDKLSSRTAEATAFLFTDEDRARAQDDAVSAAKARWAAATAVAEIRHDLTVAEAVEAGRKYGENQDRLEANIAHLRGELDAFNERTPGRCARPSCRKELPPSRGDKPYLWCPGVCYKAAPAELRKIEIDLADAEAELNAYRAKAMVHVTNGSGLSVLADLLRARSIERRAASGEAANTTDDDALVAFVEAYEAQRIRQTVVSAQTAELVIVQAENAKLRAQVANFESKQADPVLV